MGRPNTAFVLAAGLGTRMRPLTDAVPKPLVRLGGRALIDHALDRLADASITRAIVNVHYLADQIEAHLAGRTRPAIEISDERALLLDTGGGVRRALPRLGQGPFVVHNSDTAWLESGRSNITALIDAWDDARMDALLLLANRGRCLGYDGAGDFDMDQAGRLSRRPKGSTSEFVFAGVSVAHPRLLAGFDDDVFSLNGPWNAALAKGRLWGVVLDGFWMHVGTPGALAEAERRLAEGETGRA